MSRAPTWKQQEPTKAVKSGALGTFDTSLFTKAIQGLGLTFRWSRALECPCRMDNSDQWKPDCGLCGGDGWWYVSPEANRDRHLGKDYISVQCTFGQATIKDNFDQEFGGYSFTDAIMTMQSSMRVAYRDRFVGMDQEMAWNELLISAGQGTTIEVGKTTRTTDAQRGSMRYEPVVVNFVASESGGTPTYYYEGQHYRMLEPTGASPLRMQWLPGEGPALGAIFTVHYSCRPVWIVNDATYGVQALQGPESGMKGSNAPRNLPTSFKVKLDFLTPGRA
jgi:hypothetical protein